MSQISKRVGLRTIYTNHSCRATTVTTLDDAEIPSRHIMTVTGHNSEQSLKTYAGKTNQKIKKTMSEKIGDKIREKPGAGKTVTKKRKCYDDNFDNFDIDLSSDEEETVGTEPVVERNVLTEITPNIDNNCNLELLTSSQEATLISEISNDDGFDDILKTMDIPQTQVVKTQKSQVQVRSQTNHRNQFPMPVMYNCSNVTINFNILPQN